MLKYVSSVARWSRSSLSSPVSSPSATEDHSVKGLMFVKFFEAPSPQVGVEWKSKEGGASSGDVLVI
ncbi:hypothetical protein TNCV_586361 [Trichonephila clavipes]|nr:hypothetical protein TNCV_586361 [Trichonephila clavipes]